MRETTIKREREREGGGGGGEKVNDFIYEGNGISNQSEYFFYIQPSGKQSRENKVSNQNTS